MATNEDFLTSNFSYIEKYIEQNVEKKINQLMDILPQNQTVDTPKMIYEYTISELYTGTIQTVIDILNDISELTSERKYLSGQEYRAKLYDILLKKERKIYVGIVMVILSFIMYFIDGSDA